MTKKVVLDAAPHSDELCDVLYGLGGKSSQEWAEDELRHQQSTLQEKTDEIETLYAKMTEYLFDKSDIKISDFYHTPDKLYFEKVDHDSIVLNQSEEEEWAELNADVEYIYSVLYEWRDESLSAECNEAELLNDRVEELCQTDWSLVN